MRGIIAFFVPLRRAMAVDVNEGFYGTLSGSVDWIQEMRWPDSIVSLKELVGASDFVAIRFYHSIEATHLDTKPLDLAMSTASHFTRQDLGTSASTHESKYSYPVEEGDYVTGTTVVLVTTVAWRDGDSDRAISNSFDKCVRELSMLEKAYIAVSRDTAYQSFTRNNSYMASIYSTYLDGEESWSLPGVFLINPGFASQSETPLLTQQQHHDLKVTWVRARQRDPFVQYISTILEAQRALHIDGDYSQCVVRAYSSMELMLDAIWTSMAWEEITYGENPQNQATMDDVISWFSLRSTLETRLTNCFKGRLKGWNTENDRLPAYRFRYGLAKLRHRVIHAGYAPSEHEALFALDVCDELEMYIKSLLVNDHNRNRHPRTALLWMGMPGLQRRGCFAGKVKRLVERDNEENWTDSFVGFRDRLSAALGRDEFVIPDEMDC